MGKSSQNTAYPYFFSYAFVVAAVLFFPSPSPAHQTSSKAETNEMELPPTHAVPSTMAVEAVTPGRRRAMLLIWQHQTNDNIGGEDIAVSTQKACT